MNLPYEAAHFGDPVEVRVQNAANRTRRAMSNAVLRQAQNMRKTARKIFTGTEFEVEKPKLPRSVSKLAIIV